MGKSPMPSYFKAPRHAWDSLTVQPLSAPFSCLLRFLLLPECSTMVKYEQKLPSLGKYALKRAIKIKFGRK